MPTVPFPNATLDKIKSRTQAVRFKTFLGEVRQFRAYCCDINSDDIMGVAKEPVPILDVSPNPVCLGFSIDWDLTDSYAPGSTINSWEIDFGDSNSDSGVSINTASGSHTYAAIGTYTITATIGEGGGRSQEIEVEVNVVTCTSVVPETGAGVYTYVSTDGQGVFVRDWVNSLDWVERNTGLEGNALYVRSLVMKPSSKNLPDTNHELWAATMDGIYQTLNGGRSWAKLTLPNPSNIEFGDVPAATILNLDWRHIVFDPTNENIVYILASKESS